MDLEKLRLAKTKPTKKALLFQIYVGMSVGMASMAAGAWLGWPANVIPQLLQGRKCCKMSKREVSRMVAFMSLGTVLTPVPASYFMDWVGRKPTLCSTAVMNLITSVCVLVANNAWYLCIARLFAGMAKGVALAVVPIYLAEMANVQVRGALSTMFIGFLNTGVVYENIFGTIFENYAYEGLNVVNVIIPIIFVVTFFFVPESPYFLSMKSKEQKAINSLAKFRQLSPYDEIVVNEANLIFNKVKKDLKNKRRPYDIFTTRQNRRNTIIIIFLALFQRATGIDPILAYSTITLPPDGGGLSRNTYMIIFSLILVATQYVISPLVDLWGRKKLLLHSSISTGVVQFIAGMYYTFQSHKYDVTNWRWVPYACFILYACTYAFGIGFIPSTLVAELFPTNVKSYASSVSAIILAATSFVANAIFEGVADKWGVEYMYMLFTVAAIASAFVTAFFVFETKRISLFEMEDILRESH